MIVADTGAIIALINEDDPNHQILRRAFETRPEDWVLPWAVLPEIDHFLTKRLGRDTARAFRADVAGGLFSVEWNGSGDLERAREIEERYADLRLGLVDTVVMAMAERLGARAIATLDLRDFAPVELAGNPQLWPRDLR
ncbi:MAG: PIN domain-containing protein [Longimicrobiales bacterium]